MQEALEQLDPASRALLDLSLRRGMRAEDIADVLGADVDSVVRMCDGALARIAAGIGMSGGDEVARTRSLVAELPADAWPSAALAGNGASIAANGAAVNGGNGASAAPFEGEPEAMDSANVGEPEVGEPEAAEREWAAEADPATDPRAGSDTEDATDEVSPAGEATAVGEPKAAAESEEEDIDPDAADSDAEPGAGDSEPEATEPGLDAREADTKVASEPSVASDEEPAADDSVAAAEGNEEPSAGHSVAAAESDEELAADDIDALDAAVAFEAIPEIDVPEAEGGETPSQAPADALAHRSRRSLIVAMLLAVVIVAGVVVALTTTGQRKHQVASPPARVRHRATAPAPAAGTKQTLAPVGGAPAGAHATAQLVDGRRQLKLHVTGLSGGSYEVWLFNSVIDSTPIGRFDAVPADVTAALPVDFRRFRFVDVSLQSGGQTAVHSGVSVLRVPVRRLR